MKHAIRPQGFPQGSTSFQPSALQASPAARSDLCNKRPPLAALSCRTSHQLQSAVDLYTQPGLATTAPKASTLVIHGGKKRPMGKARRNKWYQDEACKLKLTRLATRFSSTRLGSTIVVHHPPFQPFPAPSPLLAMHSAARTGFTPPPTDSQERSLLLRGAFLPKAGVLQVT